MERAGVSRKGLAALVTAEAQRRGIKASPRHNSVTGWLDGVQPVPETAQCIADVMGVKLGKRIAPEDIGFTAPVNSGDVDVPPFSLEVDASLTLMDRLTAEDLSERQPTTLMQWAPGVAAGVITDYLFSARPVFEEDGSGSTVSVSADALRIQATLRHLTELDFKFGGGHTRGMLLFFWRNEILPLLRRDYPEPVRRAVFSAAADAAEVLGWSAYDAGFHGAAQRYLIYGLSLAREARDPLMGGQILSNLSHQANYLGNFKEAVQYARAGQAAIVSGGSATVNSMILAMEARALASLGDSSGCVRVLRKAEEAFERRAVGSDPEWISYFDEYEMAGEAAHCFRDLGHVQELREFTSRAIDPVHTPPRTEAFILMVGAAGALKDAGLEEALSLATSAVRLAGNLRSERHKRYFADFYGGLTLSQLRHSSATEFLELLGSSYPELLSEGAPR
jgi:hypothetical protein